MSEYNNIFIDDKCSRFCNAPHRYSFNEGLVGTAIESTDGRKTSISGIWGDCLTLAQSHTAS